jgi:hypothetical protein
MNIGSWIIGTVILWLLKVLGTIPLTRLLSRLRAPVYTSPAESETLQTDEVAGEGDRRQGKVEITPAGYYILADVLVSGVAGFLLGLISGYYFIGISWRARDWPGMIAFIVASVIGSVLRA